MTNPEFFSGRTLAKTVASVGLAAGIGLVAYGGNNTFEKYTKPVSETNPCVAFVNPGEQVTIQEIQRREAAGECKLTSSQLNSRNDIFEAGIGIGLIVASASKLVTKKEDY